MDTIRALETEFVDRGCRCSCNGNRLYIEAHPCVIVIFLVNGQLKAAKFSWAEPYRETLQKSDFGSAELADSDGFDAFLGKICAELQINQP